MVKFCNPIFLRMLGPGIDAYLNHRLPTASSGLGDCVGCGYGGGGGIAFGGLFSGGGLLAYDVADEGLLAKFADGLDVGDYKVMFGLPPDDVMARLSGCVGSGVEASMHEAEIGCDGGSSSGIGGSSGSGVGGSGDGAVGAARLRGGGRNDSSDDDDDLVDGGGTADADLAARKRNMKVEFMRKAYGTDTIGQHIPGEDFPNMERTKQLEPIRYNKLSDFVGEWHQARDKKSKTKVVKKHFSTRVQKGYEVLTKYWTRTVRIPGKPLKRELMRFNDNQKIDDIRDGIPEQAKRESKVALKTTEIFDVIYESHNADSANGKSYLTTHHALQKIYWNVTRELVTLFISLNPITNTAKPNIKPQKGAKKPIHSGEFRDRMQADLIDFTSKAVKDIHGTTMKWILVVKDHFTKLIWLAAIPAKEHVYVVEELNKYFSLVGYPRIFHSDNGGEFTAEALTKSLKEMNPTLLPVTGRKRKPQDQGSVENANKHVKTTISDLEEKERQEKPEGQRRNWIQLLPRAMATINSRSYRMVPNSAYLNTFGCNYHDDMVLDKSILRKCTTIDERLALGEDVNPKRFTAVAKKLLKEESPTEGVVVTDCDVAPAAAATAAPAPDSPGAGIDSFPFAAAAAPAPMPPLNLKSPPPASTVGQSWLIGLESVEEVEPANANETPKKKLPSPHRVGFQNNNNNEDSSIECVLSAGQPAPKSTYITVKEALETRRGHIHSRNDGPGEDAWDKHYVAFSALLLPCEVCGHSKEINVDVADNPCWNALKGNLEWMERSQITSFFHLLQHTTHKRGVKYICIDNDVARLRMKPQMMLADKKKAFSEHSHMTVMFTDLPGVVYTFAYVGSHYGLLVAFMQSRTVVVMDGYFENPQTRHNWMDSVLSFVWTISKSGVDSTVVSHPEQLTYKEAFMMTLDDHGDCDWHYYLVNDAINQGENQSECGFLCCYNGWSKIYGDAPPVGDFITDARHIVVEKYRSMISDLDDTKEVAVSQMLSSARRNKKRAREDENDDVSSISSFSEESSRDRARQKAKKLRRDQQDKQAKKWKKVYNSSRPEVKIGSLVRIQLDKRDIHISRSVLGIVFALKADTQGVRVVSSVGVLCSKKEDKVWWCPTEQYDVMGDEALAGLPELKQLQQAVITSDPFPIRAYNQLTTTAAHNLLYGASPRKAKGCRCNNGNCTNSCGCKRRGVGCNRKCSCRGNCTGNSF